jgi:hypothetical protein
MPAFYRDPSFEFMDSTTAKLNGIDPEAYLAPCSTGSPTIQ